VPMLDNAFNFFIIFIMSLFVYNISCILLKFNKNE
jgi:hypothetical protein